jgi:hypothetical protein
MRNGQRLAVSHDTIVMVPPTTACQVFRLPDDLVCIVQIIGDVAELLDRIEKLVAEAVYQTRLPLAQRRPKPADMIYADTNATFFGLPDFIFGQPCRDGELADGVAFDQTGLEQVVRVTVGNGSDGCRRDIHSFLLGCPNELRQQLKTSLALKFETSDR